jgi:hypothetical protein
MSKLTAVAYYAGIPPNNSNLEKPIFFLKGSMYFSYLSRSFKFIFFKILQLDVYLNLKNGFSMCFI